MKKVLSLILALIFCLPLCACGSSNNATKATIETNEGKTVVMSADDLLREFDGNEARFNKIYRGATIKFTGTVKNIKTHTDASTGTSLIADQNIIIFEEGWCVIIGHKNTSYDLADYYPGQQLEVSTGIIDIDPRFSPFYTAGNRVVWLVGNDKLWGREYNTQATKITPVGE